MASGGAHITARELAELDKRAQELYKQEAERLQALGILRQAGDPARAFPELTGQLERARLDILARGHILVVFPEGTRTPDGEIKAFRPGFALLASQAGVPIVPAAVHGAYEAWPRQHKLPRLGHVHVAYGAPVPPPGPGRASRREAAELVQERIVALQEALREKE